MAGRQAGGQAAREGGREGGGGRKERQTTRVTVVERFQTPVRLSIRFNSVKVLLAGLSLSEGPDPKIEPERSTGRFTADLTGGRLAAYLQTE